MHEAIQTGLPYSVSDRIAKVFSMEKAEIAATLHLTPATLSRSSQSKRFKAEEGEKFFRLTQLITEATKLFEGDEAKAIAWLKRPVKGLESKRSIDMAATCAESKEVLDLIGRLEHGVIT
jgi:putative toxin-antitoxin system antitoxin component (TIGR02293 family)